ncbi:MAG: hypothetical protein Q8O63_10880, partial [Hoeflea sp.]|nr:hypothetical protein [Hoeflea sp.]
MRQIIAASFLGLIAASAQAQSLEDIAAAARENTYPLSFSAEGLAGPGGDFLNAAATRAGITGMGEQHASADIARFATAWYADLNEMGYGHAFIEIGPWGTRAAEALLRQPAGVFEADAAARADGPAYPFLFYQEEADFARSVVQAHDGRGAALWGLDQEFIAGGSILADRLEQLAGSSRQRAAVAGFRTALEETPWLVGMGAAGSFDALEAAFADGNREAVALIAEIQRSNRIYAPFVGQGGSVYEANYVREDGMKGYFLDAWDAIARDHGPGERLF